MLDASDGAPVGLALIELAARAAVHRHHADARLLGTACEDWRVECAFVPAEPHLDRHRHLDRANHGLDQRQRMVEVAHQGRAGTAAGDLLGRAAHVDIDDVRPLAGGYTRAFSHMCCLAAGELHHMDGQAGMPYAQVEAGPALGEFAACHHFGHDQPSAMRMGALAERLVCNTRHRREEHAIADFHAADVERRGQFG